MEARTVISNRLDGFDAQAFADMVGSSSFDLLRKRIERELERAVRGCETSASLIDIHRSQGQASALRAVLALPTHLLEEIKAPRK